YLVEGGRVGAPPVRAATEHGPAIVVGDGAAGAHRGSLTDGRVGMGAAGTGQHRGGGRYRADTATDQHAAARDWRIRHGELLLISVCLPRGDRPRRHREPGARPL